MRTLVLAFALVFVPGCFLGGPKSPSQNYAISSDSFVAAYMTIVDLSRAGYLSTEDLKLAVQVKDSAKPILAEYERLIKANKADPTIPWIAARLADFLVDLGGIQAKGNAHKAEAQKNLKDILEGKSAVVPIPEPVQPPVITKGGA